MGVVSRSGAWVVALSVAAAACGRAVEPEVPASPAGAQVESEPVKAELAVLPDPTAAAEAPLVLSTGSLAARVHSEPLVLSAVSYRRGDGFEVVGFRLPLPESQVRKFSQVHLDTPGLAVVSTGPLFAAKAQGRSLVEPEGPMLWAWVPLGHARSLSGRMLVRAGSQRGKVLQFRAEGRLPAPQMGVERWWIKAVAERFAQIETPYHAFVGQRLAQAFLRESPKSALALEDAILQRLTAIESPFLAQYHSQLSRHLWRGVRRSLPTIGLKTIAVPDVWQVPFEQMGNAALPAPVEKLASFVPHDFYYLRAKRGSELMSLLGKFKQLSIPSLIDGGAALDALWVERYLTELGLSSARLQHQPEALVSQLVLTGSDLHFSVGTDLSVLLETHDPDALDQWLDEKLQRGERTTDAVTGITTIRYQSTAQTHFRARLAGAVVISNSLVALKRIIGAPRAGALASEADFKAMVLSPQRSNLPGDLLWFVGSRFIGNNVSPARKLLHSRRQMAQAELQVPAFASLLYAQLFGRPPASRAELTGTRLLLSGELRHFDGSPIRFQPGALPYSAWGRLGRMKSLLELPPVERVAPWERAAYQNFRANYEMGAGRLRSAFALRVGAEGHAANPSRYRYDLQMLPLHPGYMSYVDFLQDARVEPALVENGVRVRLGLGASSEWRQLAEQWLETEFGLRDFGAAVGTSIEVGALDRSALAGLMQASMSLPERPSDDGVPAEGVPSLSFAALKAAPVYLALTLQAGVDDRELYARLAAGLAQRFGRSAQLKEIGSYRGAIVHRVEVAAPACASGASLQPVQARPDVSSTGEACEIKLYSAVVGHRLVASPNQETLLRVIASAQSSGERALRPGSSSSAQFELNIDSEPGRAVHTLLGWLLEARVRSRQTSSVELVRALFSGDARALRRRPYGVRARHFFGLVPLTPDGLLYDWLQGEVVDPVRGSDVSPAWRNQPKVGSALATWQQALVDFQVKLSFEVVAKVDNMPIRSLHLWGHFGTLPEGQRPLPEGQAIVEKR